jgi:ribosomal-protein-alanine N-acetyltransferase
MVLLSYNCSDETINQFIEIPENRKTKIAQAITFIKGVNKYFENNKSVSLGITYKSKPGIIGTICLWNFSENNTIAEVGYNLSPEFQNKEL